MKQNRKQKIAAHNGIEIAMYNVRWVAELIGYHSVRDVNV